MCCQTIKSLVATVRQLNGGGTNNSPSGALDNFTQLQALLDSYENTGDLDMMDQNTMYTCGSAYNIIARAGSQARAIAQGFNWFAGGALNSMPNAPNLLFGESIRDLLLGTYTQQVFDNSLGIGAALGMQAMINGGAYPDQPIGTPPSLPLTPQLTPRLLLKFLASPYVYLPPDGAVSLLTSGLTDMYLLSVQVNAGGPGFVPTPIVAASVLTSATLLYSGSCDSFIAWPSNTQLPVQATGLNITLYHFTSSNGLGTISNPATFNYDSLLNVDFAATSGTQYNTGSNIAFTLFAGDAFNASAFFNSSIG